MDMDDATFVALLEPCWQAFGWKKLCIQHAPEKGLICKELYAFRVDIPAPGAGVEGTWRRQCNAIELLLLASLANPTVFMQMARKHCSLVTPTHWNEVEQDQVVPCRLVVAVDEKLERSRYPMWHLDAISLLLSPGLCTYDTPGFHKTRNALLAMAQTPSDCETWEAMKIPVCLSLAYETEERLNTMLEHLDCLSNARNTSSLATEYAGFGSAPTTQREYPFNADSIELDYSKMISSYYPKRVSTSVFGQLEKLRTKGVIFRELRFRGYVNERNCDSESYDHGMAKLGTIVIENPLSLCLGLMHSGGAEHLSLDLATIQAHSRNNDMKHWHWFFYALFHVSTSHSLQSLQLQVAYLKKGMFDQIDKFLRATQPLEGLFDKSLDPHAVSIERRFRSLVTLACNAPIFFDRIPFRDSKSLRASSESTRYVVCYSSHEMISIVVPGYGQCWVRKSDVVSEISNPFEANPERQWNLKTHRITRLEIRVGDGLIIARTEFLSLLERIGDPVKTLIVEFSGYTTFSASDLDKLWLYCPNLAELSLRYVILPSLDVFVEAYEVGTCRVASLELTSCRLDDVDSVVSFAATLGDPSYVITRTLHRLRLQFDEYNYGTDDDDSEQDEEDEGNEFPFDEMAVAFQSALRTNGYLSYIELDLDESVHDTYADEFKALNGKYLKHRYTPLPLRTKCAFLSVLEHSQSNTNQEALARMDTDVLSRMFHMASQPHQLTVLIGRVVN